MLRIKGAVLKSRLAFVEENGGVAAVDRVLASLPAPSGQPADLQPPATPAGPEGGDEELLRLDPSWIRFAPFTMTGMGAAAAIFGFAS